VSTSDWAPAVSEVGNVLRARTRDTNGNEVGTFTDKTRPTDVQVEVLINKAVSDVALRTGSDLPTQVWSDAKGVATTRAAMLVELGYFPEQVGTSRSIYPQLKDMWTQDLKDLITAVTAAGGAPNESGAPLKPAFAFPMTGDPFIIGRRTQW
jgi:hypothetical protein